VVDTKWPSNLAIILQTLNILQDLGQFAAQKRGRQTLRNFVCNNLQQLLAIWEQLQSLADRFTGLGSLQKHHLKLVSTAKGDAGQVSKQGQPWRPMLTPILFVPRPSPPTKRVPLAQHINSIQQQPPPTSCYQARDQRDVFGSLVKTLGGGNVSGNKSGNDVSGAGVSSSVCGNVSGQYNKTERHRLTFC